MADKREFRFSIITLWVGILIPIVAALIPFAMSHFSPDHRLEYDLVGPISAKETTALRLVIANNGSKVEKNVRVWLKAAPTLGLAAMLRLKGQQEKNPVDLLVVDSKTSVAVSKEREYYILAVGDIRPKEEITLSIATNEVSLSIHNFRSGPDGIEIKSEDHVASYKEDSFVTEYLYPFVFWMFVMLMIVILAAAIWQQYFWIPRHGRR